jgi:hypothetical protein
MEHYGVRIWSDGTLLDQASTNEPLHPPGFCAPASGVAIMNPWSDDDQSPEDPDGFRHVRAADPIAACRARSFALGPAGMRSVTQISLEVSFETVKYDVFLGGRESLSSPYTRTIKASGVIMPSW